MIRQLKKITIQIISGANVATILVMLLVGNSDHFDPAIHPNIAMLGLGFPLLVFINLAFLVFWLFFKPRKAIIPIVGFILCYQPIRIFFPLNVNREIPKDAIKVISYNVYHIRYEEYKDTINPILQYLLQQEADIICMQEAGYGEKLRHYTDSVLSPQFPYHETLSTKANVCEVLAIYSRYPVIGKEIIEYGSSSNISGAFHLLIGNDSVIVINNHLQSIGYTNADKDAFSQMVNGTITEHQYAEEESKIIVDKFKEAAKKRGPQADSVANYIDRNEGKSIILCGDFNDSPISYTRRTLSQKLVDCFVESGNGMGISYHEKNFYVHIDYIMCSKDWVPYQCHVDDNIAISDHYPVICWLKKRPNP